jgi:hypothetical protein
MGAKGDVGAIHKNEQGTFALDWGFRLYRSGGRGFFWLRGHEFREQFSLSSTHSFYSVMDWKAGSGPGQRSGKASEV